MVDTNRSYGQILLYRIVLRRLASGPTKVRKSDPVERVVDFGPVQERKRSIDMHQQLEQYLFFLSFTTHSNLHGRIVERKSDHVLVKTIQHRLHVASVNRSLVDGVECTELDVLAVACSLFLEKNDIPSVVVPIRTVFFSLPRRC